MTSSVLHTQPTRVQREDVAVMEQTAADELREIQKLWSSFERLVGLRGRKMYARVDDRAGTYTVCTPIKPDDQPDRLGLGTGTLAGGWYLRGELGGDPSRTYGRIDVGMAELLAAQPRDHTRPLIEFYRRHDHIELWLPIQP